MIGCSEVVSSLTSAGRALSAFWQDSWPHPQLGARAQVPVHQLAQCRSQDMTSAAFCAKVDHVLIRKGRIEGNALVRKSEATQSRAGR